MFGFLERKPKKTSSKKTAPRRMRNGMKIVGKKHEVFAGTAHHTKGGLTRNDLTVSKSSGKIVSKKQQAHGHKIMRKPHVKALFDIHRAPPFQRA